MAKAKDDRTDGMTVEQVAVADLVLDPSNARKGDVASVAASLREFGQHRPAVVQRSTRRVVVGNHMVRAAEALGWTEVAVVFVDDDDLTATRRGIADNATGDQASWDRPALARLLRDVGADVPGVTAQEAQKLEALLDRSPADAPTFPIAPEMNEKYDFVLVIAENETDAAWLATTFALRTEASYLNSHVGRGHVVTTARAQEALAR